MDERKRRASQIQSSICEVLLRDWDPIGINPVPEAQDEYESYVGEIYRLLVAGSSPEEIFGHLFKIQSMAMEIPAGDQSHLRDVANKLKQLDVSLDKQ